METDPWDSNPSSREVNSLLIRFLRDHHIGLRRSDSRCIPFFPLMERKAHAGARTCVSVHPEWQMFWSITDHGSKYTVRASHMTMHRWKGWGRWCCKTTVIPDHETAHPGSLRSALSNAVSELSKQMLEDRLENSTSPACHEPCYKHSWRHPEVMASVLSSISQGSRYTCGGFESEPEDGSCMACTIQERQREEADGLDRINC
jgi:hypothetical protein